MKVLFWILAIAAGFATSGRDAVAEDYFSGKSINLIVGVAPGGGLDSYARLFARHLGRNIPGQPNIVVQNKPGASSLTAVQSVDASSPKDGTTIVTFNPSLLLPSVVTPEKVPVDFSQFSWLGSISKQPRACFMWSATGVKTLQDMQKRDAVVMGGSGGGSTSIELKILTAIFGVRVKQIDGYSGSAETRLALERGEIDGDCTSWSSFPDDWIRDRKIVPIIRFQEGDDRGKAEGVPYAGDLVVDADTKILLSMLGIPAELGRPYILSKEVPADRLKVLRDAFDRTMKDPQFLADAGKSQLDISPMPGAAADGLLKVIKTASPAIVATAKKMMTE